MQLEKFYVDVVCPEGDGVVGYAARWRGTGVTLASTLRWSADRTAPARQRRTLRGRFPVVETEAVAWRCTPLEVAGTWRRQTPGFAEVLWADGSTQVTWEVLCPRARVDLLVDGDAMSGLGYAERLVIAGPLWRVPVSRLHWGRFIASEQSVVWIKWEHDPSRQWLWHNGVRYPPETISPTLVTWPGHRLVLDPTRTIRSGRLGDTILARWAAARLLLPGRLQRIEETKWCATATLHADHTPPVAGQAIHEFVRLG